MAPILVEGNKQSKNKGRQGKIKKKMNICNVKTHEISRGANTKVLGDKTTVHDWDTVKGQIDITMSNVVAKALVDTGASVSCIETSLFEKLFSPAKYPLQKSTHILSHAGGGKLLPVGACQLPFSLNGYVFHQLFTVTNGLSPSIILGRDFLSKYQA